MKPFAVLALSLYIALNYANIDLLIVEKNLDRYYKTGKIDTYYFYNLSFDAVLASIQLLEVSDPEIRREIEWYHEYKRLKLARYNHWQSFHRSKKRANLILNPG